MATRPPTRTHARMRARTNARTHAAAYDEIACAWVRSIQAHATPTQPDARTDDERINSPLLRASDGCTYPSGTCAQLCHAATGTTVPVPRPRGAGMPQQFTASDSSEGR